MYPGFIFAEGLHRLTIGNVVALKIVIVANHAEVEVDYFWLLLRGGEIFVPLLLLAFVVWAKWIFLRVW